MDIRPIAFENTIKVEFNPDDFETTTIAEATSFSSDGSVRAYVSKETAIAMRDRLLKIFPPDLPPEPEECGYYATRQNRLILKTTNGSWDMVDLAFTWPDGSSFTRDWGMVYSTLGADEFPFTRLNALNASQEN